MRKSFLVLLVIVQILILGCSHKWSDPADSLPSEKISIANLLANNIAYDSAGVSLTGKVWDLKHFTIPETATDPEFTYTTFTLADRKGVGLNVYASGTPPITDGSFVRVIGVYRKEFRPAQDIFQNTVDAVRIEDWKPGVVYWMREYEFD